MSGSTKITTTLSRAVVTPLARMLWRPRIVGRRNVPKRGAVILASNHRSFIDSPAITLMAPRKVSFLAKQEYFTGRGLKGRVTAGFMRGVGTIPVDRGGGKAGEAHLGNLSQSGMI